jgi:serine protease AprX
MNHLKFATVITGLLMPVMCFGAGSPRLAPDLTVDGQEVVDVIVQFTAPSSEAHLRKMGNFGGRLIHEFPSIHGAKYNVPAAALKALGDDPDIFYISPDREVTASLDYANPTVGATLATQQYGLTGSGIGIAIIDSGILEVRDLLDSSTNAANLSRISYSQSFVAKTPGTTDQYGHGTHVAGIAAGNAASSTGASYTKSFRGMAPNATLINLRVLDAKGVGTDSSVIGAIDTAIRIKNKYNIRVINLSLGRPVFETYKKDPLCQAVERAWKAGIVVVVAAGNEGRNDSQGTQGYATITSPANHPLVITVGAMKTLSTSTRADDLVASYSSKGPTLIDHVVKPDIVSPGNRLISLVASKSLVAANSTSVNKIPYAYYQNTSSKTYSADYVRLSGTSMAAAAVSGAAALMLEKDWSLTNETVKARLMKTASKFFPTSSTTVDPVTGQQYTSQYDIFTIGAGHADLMAALGSADFVLPGSTAASPTAIYDPITREITVLNADTSIWGTAAVWGTAAIWGTAAVWGTNVFVDGQAAIWGTSTLWGSAAVWGTGNTKGNAAIWGTAAVWGTGTKPGGESLSQLINGDN